ncbi:PIF1-like helicase [Hirsutella rhossiliensis]
MDPGRHRSQPVSHRRRARAARLEASRRRGTSGSAGSEGGVHAAPPPRRDRASEARTANKPDNESAARGRAEEEGPHPGGQAEGNAPGSGGPENPKTEELQAEDLASVLQHLEEEFAAGERLADEQTWCMPVPRARQVRTVQRFYRAFHDAGTLPVLTCKSARGASGVRASPGMHLHGRLGCEHAYPDELKGLTPVERS